MGYPCRQSSFDVPEDYLVLHFGSNSHLVLTRKQQAQFHDTCTGETNVDCKNMASLLDIGHGK